jgi:two-component sensor histidine kinase
MPQRLMNSRLMRLSIYMKDKPVLAYGSAIAMAVLAFMLRLFLTPYLPTNIPYYTFLPAVMIVISAFICGTRPAIVCMLLSLIAAAYVFIPPFKSFRMESAYILPFTLFTTFLTINLYIVDVLNNLIVKFRHEKEVTNELLEQQRTLFQELQHRVANNLGFVSNLLTIQKGRVINCPDAQSVLDDARIRLDMMSRVHRRLYDPSNADLPLPAHLRSLCEDVLEASCAQNVTCHVDVPDIDIDLEKTLNLSLVVIEAVTNSLKHAFTDGRDGEIRITMTSYGLSHYMLVVQDNGKGFPEGFDPAQSDRLGFKILTGFARSLNGDIEFANQNGGQVKLVFGM